MRFRGFKHIFLIGCCGLSFLAAMTIPLTAEEAVKPSPKVRVGVVGTLFRDTPPIMVTALMKPFKSLLDSQTGIDGQMVATKGCEDLGKQLANDKVQLGVFHGFEFAWARISHPELKPLLICIYPPPCKQAILVVQKDGGVDTLEALKGKTLTIPMHTREHCHLFLERRCLALGKPTNKFFDKVTTPADLEDALDAVVDGTAQASLVDGGALANFAKRKPGRFAKLKTLLESEAFPSSVIACNPNNFDEAVQKRFTEGLINSTQTSSGQRLLTICRISGFEMIPASFDKELTAIAKSYPPPQATAEK